MDIQGQKLNRCKYCLTVGYAHKNRELIEHHFFFGFNREMQLKSSSVILYDMYSGLWSVHLWHRLPWPFVDTITFVLKIVCKNQLRLMITFLKLNLNLFKFVGELQRTKNCHRSMMMSAMLYGETFTKSCRNLLKFLDFFLKITWRTIK